MMHRAWSSIVEVPYFLSRSYVQFQGHTALKIVEFDPNWAFPDSNASLNSPMAMKCCTKLETAKERCPIVFQGHPSNFKVTRDKTSPILTQIGRFRTIGRSQLSNPSDLPCCQIISVHLSVHLSQALSALWFHACLTDLLHTCIWLKCNPWGDDALHTISSLKVKVTQAVHIYNVGFWWLRGATAFRSLYLLVFLHGLVQSCAGLLWMSSYTRISYNEAL